MREGVLPSFLGALLCSLLGVGVPNPSQAMELHRHRQGASAHMLVALLLVGDVNKVLPFLCCCRPGGFVRAPPEVEVEVEVGRRKQAMDLDGRTFLEFE